jgi:hypothetical protein
MTAHVLAKQLLALPDLPVVIEDRDGDEWEVRKLTAQKSRFFAEGEAEWKADGYTPFRPPSRKNLFLG